MEFKVNLNVEKTEGGFSYVRVYQVIAVKPEGQRVLIIMFFSEKEALEHIEFCRRVYNTLYEGFFVKHDYVWL